MALGGVGGGQNISWRERQRLKREAAAKAAAATPVPETTAVGAGGIPQQKTPEDPGPIAQGQQAAPFDPVVQKPGGLGHAQKPQLWFDWLQQQGSIESMADALANMPGSADVWAGITGQAQQGMEGAISAADPTQNPFTQLMQQILGQSPDFGTVGAAPVGDQPTDVIPGFDLTGDMAFDPTADVTGQFDINNLQQLMTDVLASMGQVPGVGGPGVGAPGAVTGDIMGQFGTGPALEDLDIARSGFQEDPMFQQLMGQSQDLTGQAAQAIGSMGNQPAWQEAFQRMLSMGEGGFQPLLDVGQGLAETSFDTSGLIEALQGAETGAFERAGTEARNIGGGRGFTDPGGGVTGNLLGKGLGQAASESAARTQEALLRAAGMETEARTAGGGLIGQGLTGQMAAFSDLSKFLTGAGDVGGQQAALLSDLSGQLAGQGLDIGQLLAGENVDVLNALLGEQANVIGGFQAGTQAAGTAGGIYTQMSQQQQTSAVQKYEAETGRQAVVAGAVTDEASNWIDAYAQDTDRHGKTAIAAYGAATERGQANQAAQEAAAAMGLAYDQLNVDQRQTFDQLMADVWQAGGAFTQDQNRILQSLYDSQLTGAATMANITGGQGIDFLNSMTNILMQAGQSQQEANELMTRALQGDTQALIEFMNVVLTYDVNK